MANLYLRSFVLGCLVLVYVFFLLPTTTEAATYYVSPGDSLAVAIGKLQVGDTLYLRGGTYSEAIDSGRIHIPSSTSWSSAVTIASAPGEEAILTGGINLEDAYPISYVIFDRLTIDGLGSPTDPNAGTKAGFRAVGYVGGLTHIRFSNGEIRNSANNLVQGGGNGDMQIINNKIHGAYVCNFANANGATSACYGMYFNSHDSLIEGNTIYDNSGYAIHHYISHGGGVNNNIIRNNVFYNNCYSDGERGFGLGAVIIASGSNNQFYNNVVYNNTGSMCRAAVAVAYAGDNNQVYNNTIYGNGSGAGIEIGENVPNTIVKNNIVYNNSSTIANSGTNTTLSHNYTTDPQFINPTGIPPDFHLQSSSPARTASDTGGEVGAYANGGGPGSGGGTPTPTPTGRFCATLLPGSTITTGFGKPWNVFNVSELLLKAICSGSEKWGVLGPSTYIYHQGYAWVNNAWSPVNFTCTGGGKVSSAWCPNTAQGMLPAETSYYVGYTCNWTGTKWNCGCADTACSSNYWQLQKIN